MVSYSNMCYINVHVNKQYVNIMKRQCVNDMQQCFINAQLNIKEYVNIRNMFGKRATVVGMSWESRGTICGYYATMCHINVHLNKQHVNIMNIVRYRCGIVVESL